LSGPKAIHKALAMVGVIIHLKPWCCASRQRWPLLHPHGRCWRCLQKFLASYQLDVSSAGSFKASIWMCNLPQVCLNEVGQVELTETSLQQVLWGNNLWNTGNITNHWLTLMS